jgi:hypothetical protein
VLFGRFERRTEMFDVWKSVKKDGNPSLPGMYLVTIEFETYGGIRKRYVDCLEYTPYSTWVSTWVDENEEIDGVIAWMENPEVYHGE